MSKQNYKLITNVKYRSMTYAGMQIMYKIDSGYHEKENGQLNYYHELKTRTVRHVHWLLQGN